MIKRKLRKCQLGQNGIPVKQTSMWDTNVPNFNNPYVTAPLTEDDWHHNVDNISFPGEGMTSLNPKNSKYFSQEELLNPSEEETSGNTQSTGDSKNKIKNKFNFNFNPAAYAKLQGLNGLLEGIGNIYQHSQQNQSRINMNPLSGLDFSNGRSEQSKYGYSFQKGGYTVKKGDNLTKIAKQYNVPLNELLRLNYIQDSNLIYPGQEINLPKTKQTVKSIIPVNTKDYSINRPVNISKSNKATMSASLGLPNNKQNIVSGSASIGLPKSNIQVPIKTVKTPIKIESKPVQNKGFTNSLVYKKPDFKNPVWIGEVQPKASIPNKSKNVIKGAAELNPYPGKINEVKKMPRNMYEKKIFKNDFVYDKNEFMSDPNIPQLVKDLYEKELNINPNKKANIVDKATNTQYITLDNGNIKPLQVITGKNPKGIYEYKSLDEIEKSPNHFRYKVTPEGKFSYEGSVNDTDKKDYNNNIYAFNKFNVAQHQLYNPEVRSKWLNTGNPKDRYGSYGCVNCRKEDFETYIKNNFSKKDSILILNSDKTLEEFEKQYKKNSFQKGGSFLDQEDFLYGEDFLYEEENDYTENDAQKTERVTDEQIKQEIRKRNKYSLDNDYLGLFEKSRRRLRQSQDYEVTENYEPAKTNTSENQSFAFNYLQQKGLQPHQAAGVVGNFTQESNMNPGITNGIGAFGAGQWLGPRKKALFQYAKITGKDPYHLQTQLDFTLHELSTTEKKAGNALGNTKTSAEAAKVFRKMYERPGESESNDKRRIQEAKKLYPYQVGGNFVKDPTMEALSNVYTQRNRGIPWVDRGLNPQNYPINNQQQFMNSNAPMTHRLSYYSNLDEGESNYQVIPDINYNQGNLEWDNKQQPINFSNKQMAKYYSQNGLIKHKKKGGSLSNWEIIEY